MSTLYDKLYQARQALEQFQDRMRETTQEIGDKVDILVCYQSHYEIPTFSIFQCADNEVDDIIERNGLRFLIDTTLQEKQFEPVIKMIIEEVYRDKDC